jgi:hypothetical protein
MEKFTFENMDSSTDSNNYYYYFFFFWFFETGFLCVALAVLALTL